MTTGLPDTIETAFVGKRARLFKLAMVTGFWTLITLGFYRFWAKTRLRRWYWSAIRPGGQPVEYTGVGSEKLAGFFLAVSILAFWLGVVNLLLMFASLSIWAIPGVAYVLSFVGLVPVWFFARYRARSYILARTRWRGIRFGMAPGAWGYAGRAIIYLIVTILSLGILWPRMTFLLEKYRSDRSYFGDHRITQGGQWTMLMAPFGYVIAAVVAMFVALGFSYFTPETLVWALAVTVPLVLVSVLYYRVTAWRIMASHKSAGGLGLNSGANALVVARIVVFGAIALAILMLIPLLMLGGLANLVNYLVEGPVTDLSRIGFGAWMAIVGAVVSYFFVFMLWSGLRHIFVTMPLWRHYADTLEVTGSAEFCRVGQRGRDAANEAGGFAEALDLGAAI